MTTNGIQKIHRQKRLAEGLIVTGLVFTLISSGAFVFFHHAGLYTTLIAGLLFAFFGYANFTHLRENFKSRLIASWTASWVKGGDYDPRNGLSKNQILKSLLFSQDARFETHDLISGSLQGIAFISSDVKNISAIPPVFHGRLFAFEFNHTFIQNLIHIPQNHEALLDGFEKTKAYQKAYDTYIPKGSKPMLSSTWVKAFEKLEKIHTQRVALSLVDSKLYLTINDQEDAFIMRLFKPLDLKKITAFQTDVRHLTELIKTFKNNKANFMTE